MRGTFKIVATVGLALTLGACAKGGGGGSAPDPDEELSRFTGTWRSVSGTRTTVCAGYQPSTSTVSSNLTWEMGVTSDLVQADDDTPCVINADVVGATASGEGPACTIATDDGTVTLTVPNYTFVISPDGRTASENATGSAVINASGATVTCTVTLTATYQKLSK